LFWTLSKLTLLASPHSDALLQEQRSSPRFYTIQDHGIVNNEVGTYITALPFITWRN